MTMIEYRDPLSLYSIKGASPSTPAPGGARQPADMHDAHLANAIAKAERTGDGERLTLLTTERARRAR